VEELPRRKREECRNGRVKERKKGIIDEEGNERE
jgi:hypothetical protein